MAGCYYVYILASKQNGTLYIGVTNDLAQRITRHREGNGSGFCAKYGIHKLVYAEEHPGIDLALQREKSLKKWPRKWKLNLIESLNPNWEDLYETL